MPRLLITLMPIVLLSACTGQDEGPVPERAWLAGDHHIHSRFSVGWDDKQTPPEPVVGGDAIYPIPMNNLMAKHFGLSWTVATDHGGPNHSKVSLELAYPELLQSRAVLPDMVQFFGLELNSPGGDHSSLIVPHTHDEGEILADLERRFDKREAFPLDHSHDTEDRMLEALDYMKSLPQPPVVIANHPSRSALDYGVYGYYSPEEFRNWNDKAPNVAIGMAGAPGHQAIAFSNSNRFIDDRFRARGGYGRYPTLGGFDQMTATLGGFWDAMLGEGRRWWITANSDSHVHYTEGGIDFWPGEYSKTYVWAEKTHADVLDGLRGGRIFVTTGDLISAMDFAIEGEQQRATLGGEYMGTTGETVTVTIRITDPDTKNHNDENPVVRRVDLVYGDVIGPAADRSLNANPTTRVQRRFTSDEWKREGNELVMTTELTLTGPAYLRLRGTNTDELEPETDPPAENPWQDLWFYSNPIFISVLKLI